MPTAARLVSAFMMAVVTAAMAILFVGVYPDEPWDSKLNSMIWVFGICGALVGWFSLGKRVETDTGRGFVLGFRAAITVTVVLLFVLSINHMWGEIMAERLKGARPMEAIFVMFNKGAELAGFILNPRILGFGLFGYICTGVIARNTYFRWN